jgi:hypothetical protein
VTANADQLNWQLQNDKPIYTFTEFFFIIGMEKNMNNEDNFKPMFSIEHVH